MLAYCLLSATIAVPIVLIGYYQNLINSSTSLCRASNIHYLTVNIGMLTSLAFASVERHYLIFRRNGPLTWQRQLLPVLLLLIYSYMVAVFFSLFAHCSYSYCVSCHATAIKYMVPWLVISFVIPMAIMMISTISLLNRLHHHKTALNRKTEWVISRRIVLQMITYTIWASLYYCPISFYNLSVIIDTSLSSPRMRTITHLINTMSVQSYSVLTFIAMLVLSKRNAKRRANSQSIRLKNASITNPLSNLAKTVDF